MRQGVVLRAAHGAGGHCHPQGHRRRCVRRPRTSFHGLFSPTRTQPVHMVLLDGFPTLHATPDLVWSCQALQRSYLPVSGDLDRLLGRAGLSPTLSVILAGARRRSDHFYPCLAALILGPCANCGWIRTRPLLGVETARR